jgi:adenylyltransferase/sulfurtransferase
MSAIEIDAKLPVLEVPPRILNEIASHAREALPEECCGLVSGSDEARYRQVHRCRNEMTRLHRLDPARHPRDGRQAFHMSEHDQLEAMKEAESRAERITAVYHSHPGLGVYFSELDQAFATQELFPFPDADHIVVSIIDGRVEAGLFLRRGDAFVGRVLRAAGA